MLRKDIFNNAITWSIAITGSQHSGNSSLIRRYAKDTYYEDGLIPTAGADHEYKSIKIEDHLVTIGMWAVSREIWILSESLTEAYKRDVFNDANAILLTCDLTNNDALNTLEIDSQAIQPFINENTVIAIVGTKKDDARNVVITETELRNKAAAIYGPKTLVMTVSAKTGENIQELFQQVYKSIVARLNSPKSKTPLVDKYDDISRNLLWSIRFRPETAKSKDIISDRLSINHSDGEDIKNAKIEILASLTAFKYYRQFLTKNVDQQELLLGNIKLLVEDKKYSCLNLSLRDLMRYVRNDDFFIQKKIPGHLHDSLEAVLISEDYSPRFHECLNKLCKNELKDPQHATEENLHSKIEKFVGKNVDLKNKIKKLHT